jgi:DNA-binding CsgD family transcriptional regulator
LFPEDLRTSQYHQYVLLLLQAKDKSYRDISADTLIFATKKYYVKKNDFENAALSAFYCGRVLQEQKKNEKALRFYLNAALLEIQAKYDFANLKDNNIQLVVKQQKILLITAFALLLIGLIAFLFYRKSMHNQKSLYEADQKIDSLNNMAKLVSEEKQAYQNQLKNVLFNQFNVLKKISLLEKSISENDRQNGEYLLKKINRIIYKQDQLDWVPLYQTMDQLHEGFYTQLRKQYPQLNENEFRICCLSYKEFNDAEIAVLLNTTPFMIQKNRSKIRKQIGVPNHGNLRDFLREQLAQTVK